MIFHILLANSKENIDFYLISIGINNSCIFIDVAKTQFPLTEI